MRNPVSISLYTLGTLIIVGSFIAGIVVSSEINHRFEFSAAIIWWSSGIILGIFFIGLGEIINLLQKLLDHKHPSDRSSSTLFSSSKNSEAFLSLEYPEDMNSDNHDVIIKDLTIVMNNERFKGQFVITPEQLTIFKKSFFQEDAEVIVTINKNTLFPLYEKNKEYVIFSYRDLEEPIQISFKTYNMYDYQKVIDHLQLQPKAT